jgi:peroxiredoxin
MKSKIQMNTPAPDFELADFRDQPVRLADFRDQKNVLLIFNRGFA